MKKNRFVLTVILTLSIAATLVGCGVSNDIADSTTTTTSAYVSIDGIKETPSQVSSETKVDGTVVTVFSDGTIIETAMDGTIKEIATDGVVIETAVDGSKKEITPDGVVTIVEQPTTIAPTIEPTQAPVVVAEEVTLAPTEVVVAPTQAPTPVVVETPIVTPTPEPIEHTPTQAPPQTPMVSTFPNIQPSPATVVTNGLTIEFENFYPSMSELNGAGADFASGKISASEAKARLMSLTGEYSCRWTNMTYTKGTGRSYYADAGFYKKGEYDLNNTVFMELKDGFFSSALEGNVDGTKYIYWTYVQMVKN